MELIGGQLGRELYLHQVFGTLIFKAFDPRQFSLQSGKVVEVGYITVNASFKWLEVELIVVAYDQLLNHRELYSLLKLEVWPKYGSLSLNNRHPKVD